MKTDDLNLRVEVGQYWVDRWTLEVRKVSKVEENQISFEDGSTYVPPMGNSLSLLWHTAVIYKAAFQGSVTPVPGQLWVASQSQDVFFIHPDQGGLKVTGGVQVLSNSSRLDGKCFLVQDVTH